MSRAQAAVAATATLNLLATISVILRVISRFYILKGSSADDYLIILGLVLSWVLTGLTVAQAHFGLGQHQDQVSAKNYQNLILCLWIYIPVYNITLTVTKLSALFQFLRFFVMPTTRAAAWVLIAIVFMYGVAVPVASVCSCIPVESFWIESLPGKCIDLAAFWYFNSSFNVATDIAVVALPLYVLKDLRLPKRQKWAVMSVFAVGIFTCITSAVRLWTVDILLRENDSSYNNAPAAMWSSIEVNTAIVCACMQSLKPLVQKIRPHWLTQSESSSNATGSSGSAWKMNHIRQTAGSENEAGDGRYASSTEPILGGRSC